MKDDVIRKMKEMWSDVTNKYEDMKNSASSKVEEIKIQFQENLKSRKKLLMIKCGDKGRY